MPVNPLPLVLYIFLFASSRANTKESMIICRFIFTGVVACCFWLGGFLVWLFFSFVDRKVAPVLSLLH